MTSEPTRSNLCFLHFAKQGKADASRAYRRLASNPNNLVAYLQDDDSIRPLYTVNQITEGAVVEEEERVLNEAECDTRAKYSIELTKKSVIRWLLWQQNEYLGFGGDADAEEHDENPMRDASTPSRREGIVLGSSPRGVISWTNVRPTEMGLRCALLLATRSPPFLCMLMLLAEGLQYLYPSAIYEKCTSCLHHLRSGA